MRSAFNSFSLFIYFCKLYRKQNLRELIERQRPWLKSKARLWIYIQYENNQIAKLFKVYHVRACPYVDAQDRVRIARSDFSKTLQALRTNVFSTSILLQVSYESGKTECRKNKLKRILRIVVEAMFLHIFVYCHWTSTSVSRPSTLPALCCCSVPWFLLLSSLFLRCPILFHRRKIFKSVPSFCALRTLFSH